MPSASSLFFDTVLTYNGSSFTPRTLEAQSPAGTAFALLEDTNDYLYLGHAERFDMAIFDLDTSGSYGALTWQYYNGSAWTTFIPASARYQLDPDDNEGGQYGFSKDGGEEFPTNVLAGWATNAVDSITKYWVRVSAASVSTVATVKRIQMRAVNAYCTTADVFNFMQLGNVLGGSDFTTTTTP